MESGMTGSLQGTQRQRGKMTPEATLKERGVPNVHSPSANFGGLCWGCLNTVEHTVAFLQLLNTPGKHTTMKAASTRLSVNPLALLHSSSIWVKAGVASPFSSSCIIISAQGKTSKREKPARGITIQVLLLYCPNNHCQQFFLCHFSSYLPVQEVC